MIRIILDTSILISAAFLRETAPRHVVRWVASAALMLRSVETEQEFFRTIDRPKFKGMIDPTFVDFTRRLFATAELVPITEHVTACRDANDDKFLSLAISGNADFIVTGDKDILERHPFRGIPILTASEFLTRQNS